MSDRPEPSPAARELVRGGYDPHVHIAADVLERRIDDLTIGPADQRELAARGVYLERRFTTAHTGNRTWDTVFDFLAAGFTEEEVHTMAVTDTVALAGSTS